MEEKTVITSRLDELTNYDWLSYILEGSDDIVIVNDEKSIAEAAELWGVTPELVKAIKEALDFMSESLIGHIKQDLIDIWKAVKE